MKGNPIDEAAKNYKTRIGKKIKREVVLHIWKCLSEWIADSLMSYKCVLLKNVGTFTLARWKLDTGVRKTFPVQRPAFQMSHKLVFDYRLKQVRTYTSNKLPLVVPNYLLLSATSGCDKPTIEECVNEILQALSRMLYEERDLRLVFPDLGVLEVVNKEVRFRFDDGFSNKISLRTPPIPRPPPCPRSKTAANPPQTNAPSICAFHRSFNELRKRIDI